MLVPECSLLPRPSATQKCHPREQSANPQDRWRQSRGRAQFGAAQLVASLPRRRCGGLPPIVCVLAFGASAAAADPGVTRPPAAAERRVVSHDSQQHDALIAEQRAGRITAAQALKQLKAWLAMPLDHAARQRAVSDAISIAVDEGQFAEAAVLGRKRPAGGMLLRSASLRRAVCITIAGMRAGLSCCASSR